jgi:FkbM family methyltransferase
MLEELSTNILNDWSLESALDMLIYCIEHKKINEGKIIGEFMVIKFPYSFRILHEYAIILLNANEHSLAYDVFSRMLNMKGINEDCVKRTIYNQSLIVPHIKDMFIKYPEIIVKSIYIDDVENVDGDTNNTTNTNTTTNNTTNNTINTNNTVINTNKFNHSTNQNQPRQPRLFTFSITTCKRLDLFVKTMNSFLTCCLDVDLISDWICVDDNSSEEDRKTMKKLYPFFNFRLKSPSEKGHPTSMNMIKSMVKTPYIFHMEDDWVFFEKRRYITECHDVLCANTNIMQCLVNKNYGEVHIDNDLLGGIYSYTDNFTRYYIHEHVKTLDDEKQWISRHSSFGRHCNYWPHFSLRPGLWKTKLLKVIGDFSLTSSHFEMEYAERYESKGYVTAFLEKIHCKHIGRLTKDMNNSSKTNAYILNDEQQFTKGGVVNDDGVIDNTLSNHDNTNDIVNDTTQNYACYIVNLDSRIDRMKSVEKIMNTEGIKFTRFPAVDGNRLKSSRQLQRIFDGNDYNMRRGMVGCALSHIKLYIQLLKDDKPCYLILEDDITVHKNFKRIIGNILREMSKIDWDIIYVGHHSKLCENIKIEELHLTKYNRFLSLNNSLGGTFGYLISKKGALKLLNFINKTGMTNGIDTVQQKSADDLNVYYSFPSVVYSECFRDINIKIDTDIQYNYDSLSVDFDTKIRHEHRCKQVFNESSFLEELNANSHPFFMVINDPELYNKLYKKVSILKQDFDDFGYFTIDSRALFVIPSSFLSEFYVDRLKYMDEYNIDHCMEGCVDGCVDGIDRSVDGSVVGKNVHGSIDKGVIENFRDIGISNDQKNDTNIDNIDINDINNTNNNTIDNTNIFNNIQRGFFIDVGAYDGISDNTTYILEKDLNWKGVCIEPLPSAYLKLISNRPKSNNINLVVHSSEEKMKFIVNECGSNHTSINTTINSTTTINNNTTINNTTIDKLSGIKNKMGSDVLMKIVDDIKIHGGKSSIIDVHTKRLSSIMSSLNISFVDYLSLNTSYSDFDIIKSLDLSKFGIISFLNSTSIFDYLSTLGYVQLKNDGKRTYMKL